MRREKKQGNGDRGVPAAEGEESSVERGRLVCGRQRERWVEVDFFGFNILVAGSRDIQRIATKERTIPSLPSRHLSPLFTLQPLLLLSNVSQKKTELCHPLLSREKELILSLTCKDRGKPSSATPSVLPDVFRRRPSLGHEC
jgi:hypothetical protein